MAPACRTIACVRRHWSLANAAISRGLSDAQRGSGSYRSPPAPSSASAPLEADFDTREIPLARSAWYARNFSLPAYFSSVGLVLAPDSDAAEHGHLRLAAVPPVSDAQWIAQLFWEHLGIASYPCAPADVIVALGWRFEEQPLGATDGGLQALLLPRPAGGFTVLVDPRSSPAGDRSPSLIDRRAAHEIGHTLFYSRGNPPRRMFPPAPHEEQFCDAFAHALLAA